MWLNLNKITISHTLEPPPKIKMPRTNAQHILRTNVHLTPKKALRSTPGKRRNGQAPQSYPEKSATKLNPSLKLSNRNLFVLKDAFPCQENRFLHLF